MTRTKGAKNLLPPGTQKWWPAEEVLRLHERIRELEAEAELVERTARERRALDRAEKAEAQVFRWSQGQIDMERKLADLEKDLEKSEARVADEVLLRRIWSDEASKLANERWQLVALHDWHREMDERIQKVREREEG